jgi:tRNA G18 (ribose-2'-O)-methylase SpoU
MKRYLIIANISKRNNVIQLINAAKAYEFQAILVGAVNIRELLPAELMDGLILFDRFKDLKAWVKEQENLKVVGIEITEDSQSVLDYAFPQKIAVMPGNEGTGLNNVQRDICDAFVYIPHYGEGTASLNVNVATSIVIHHCSLQTE